MGLSIDTSATAAHPHTHKVFIPSNYILLGAASSCIFLTLSLRLFPSLIGFLFILLHVTTIVGAVSDCAAASRTSSTAAGKFYDAHMVATVLTAIFQGSASVLIFSCPSGFFAHLKSYVREENGAMILKLTGGGAHARFFLNYYAYVERKGGVNGGGGKVQDDEDLKSWPWPFLV